ncbi:MAG TPA: PSD1 and planctomycete cytochrome C domain-containing protein [Gemmataceae bacterium]|nr:PSD1 and planctomycete cytochrome C domain-containing protein [Gemmataceae bacterium]
MARLGLLSLLSCFFAATIARAETFSADDFFEREVRPLLVEHCQKCHGDNKPKGGLRLTSRDWVLKGGDNGPAAVAGKPQDSLLIQAVRYGDTLQMPPKRKLSDRQIATLTRWVQLGLPWPQRIDSAAAEENGTFQIAYDQRCFWSFQPMKAVLPPQVRDTAWAKSDIDRFILAGLEAKGLRSAKQAEKRMLLRRVTFDLTGLPPAPQEMEAFLRDDKPGAFARVVERLLASPAYGERWGRHWLDLVRYTDSFDARGIGGEMDCADAWRYRDWVVQAFNGDLPYDKFVTDQIAGDLVPSPGGLNRDGIIATGFLALGNWGGGDADKEKLLTDIADDQVDVVSRTFLGLTVACARCHDHKFDPISTADYYALAGIFFSTHILANVGPKTNGPPMLRIPLVPSAEVEALKKTKKPIPYANGAQDGGVPGSPHAGTHDVRIHIRGRYDRLGPLAPRRFPEILAGREQKPIASGSGRLDLARWLTRPDHPLTARVMVNRIWQQHFGEGIVRTPSNFGKLGRPPTHPELLDWLALEFVRSGWSIKQMHRLILSSATYQQSSEAMAETLKSDPDNLLFGRMNRRRLEAEALRDSMLAVSGRLDRASGGPAVRDFAAPRRTLYLTTIRSDRSGFGPLFDAADPTAPVDKRTVSTVAPQALFLMNNPFVLAQTQALAKRLLAIGTNDLARIEHAYVLLYGRPPTAEEVGIGLDFLHRAGAGERGWEEYGQALLCANEFSYVD